MTKAVRDLLHNEVSYDEPDRMPDRIHVTRLDIYMYIVAIVGHFVDLGLDINIAVRYFLAQRVTEFGWTLAFILVPAFVNTAVSIRMYAQDKQQHLESVSDQVTRRKWLRIFILVLQMAPILRFTDALIYALKSRRSERHHRPDKQRAYYALMLKEDADAALLRVFEGFLEAAPQQVLQTSLLMYSRDFAVHQSLSIASSVVGLGWCLAAYQRAIRYAQDKDNITWTGTIMQTLYHFLITLSRIISISILAYMYPHWTILACCLHILLMAVLIQLHDRSSFCSQSRLADIAFSLALGAVYLFTYILPVEGRTRYRYAMYYTLCFLQNLTCGLLWYLYVNDLEKTLIYFYPVLVLSVVPFLIGICIMVMYYLFFHPKLRKIAESDIIGVGNNFVVEFKANGDSQGSTL